LRIAILTHATGPRGGGVHALSLGEALCALGHEAVVHAPDPTGSGFFRNAACPVVSVAAKPVAGPASARAGARIADYLAHFATPAACDFDVFHAQCSISGNALATLARRRLIPGFVRTVHSVTTVADPTLARWQDRAIIDAARLLTLSQIGALHLAAEYGVAAEVVGNGVDGAAFNPEPDSGEAALSRRLGLSSGPIFLSVGGFEPRKNTLAIIEAFAILRRDMPHAQLVLAGADASGDQAGGQAGGQAGYHAGYHARCCAALEREGLEVGPGRPVIRTGSIAQADMPGLYRLADTLVSPSLAESFGLCVLESVACGTPVVVPARAPFSEYLPPDAALWVDPGDTGAIAAAMRASLEPARRARLRNRAPDLLRAHGWSACAARHLPVYAALAPEPSPAVPFATGAAAWNVLWVPPDA